MNTIARKVAIATVMIMKRIPTNMLEIACFVSARLRMVRMVVDSTGDFL